MHDAGLGIDGELRKKYEIPNEVKGVLITEVNPNGSAAEKNLEAGDVIVEVNQDAVTTAGDVAVKIDEAVKAGKDSVLLLVNRSGDRRFVVVSVKQNG